tara:strand:+ start:2725 stop:3048 length:324 start_codon:yes stop_codon:yes gene_type:complete
MKMSDIINEGISPKLYMVLKQLQTNGVTSIKVDQLNDKLANMGLEAFSYETFALQHNDPRIKKLIKNFNKDEIIFAQGSADVLSQAGADGKEVSQMAKRATKVGDNL